MNRPIHFEIHAENLDRAQAFYEGLFGWTFQVWGGPMEYRVITTGPEAVPGINGGLVRRMGPNPDPKDPTPMVAWGCTMDVADLDASLARATDLGGSVVVPKTPVPGVGWLAYCKDTEANIFGMMQPDSNAK